MHEKTGIQILLNNAATDTIEAFSQSVSISHSRYHSLYLFWTPGQASNVLDVNVYTSISDVQLPDSDKRWTQDMKWTLGSSHWTRELVDIQHTAADGNEVPLRFDLEFNANAMRIGYSETVSAGVLDAYLASRGQ